MIGGARATLLGLRFPAGHLRPREVNDLAPEALAHFLEKGMPHGQRALRFEGSNRHLLLLRRESNRKVRRLPLLHRRCIFCCATAMEDVTRLRIGLSPDVAALCICENKRKSAEFRRYSYLWPLDRTTGESQDLRTWPAKTGDDLAAAKPVR